MSKIRILAILVVALTLGVLAAGCAPAPSPVTVKVVETVVVEKEVEKIVVKEVEKIVEKAPEPSKEVTIVVLMSNAGDPYFQNKSYGYVQGAGQLEAENPGLKVNLELFNAGGYEFSEVQIGQMEDAIQRKVNGIILTATNSEALVPVTESAMEAGIPVIADDVLVSTDKVTMKISENSCNVGRQEANAVARAINFEGGVVLLKGPAAGAGSLPEERARCAEEEFINYPNIKILGEQYHNSNLADSTKVMEDFIQAFGDKIKGVYAFGTVSSMGAAEALKTAGIEPGKVVIGAIDLHKEGLAYMNDGWLHCIIAAQPIKLANLAVKYAYAASQGQKVPSRVYTSDEMCLTQEDLKTFSTNDAMAPDGWTPPLR